MDSWISGGMMLVKLGLAVYEAVQKGERTKTVGEIFDGVPRDQEALDRLRDEARAHYAAQAPAVAPVVHAGDLATLRRLTSGAVLSHEERGALTRLLAAAEVRS